MLDVLIVGGGAAGYGCALTLASVEDKFQWAKERQYLMLDNGQSDILKARFYNLAGVEFGIGGDELLDRMQKQLAHYQSIQQESKEVCKIEDIPKGFRVICRDNTSYEASFVVLATGMHLFDIDIDGVEILTHNDVLKPKKVCLKHTDNKIRQGLYVAGLASGAKTMFAIANGEGSKVACQIFKEWTGKPMVAHDSLKD
jgi:thioredoxin reductase